MPRRLIWVLNLCLQWRASLLVHVNHFPGLGHEDRAPDTMWAGDKGQKRAYWCGEDGEPLPNACLTGEHLRVGEPMHDAWAVIHSGAARAVHGMVTSDLKLPTSFQRCHYMAIWE